MTDILSDDSLLALKYFLKDDIDALRYALDILYISHLWDDLIDKDISRTDEDINQGFIKSLGEIPINPFYQAYQYQLAPMMANALTMWLESNELEKGSRDERMAALHIRNAVLHIIHYCILLKGGIMWSRQVGPEFWRYFGMNEEKYETFMLEAQNV